MRKLIVRLIADDDGQDLVETGLLAAVIGFASLAGFEALRAALVAAYGAFDTGMNALWQSPDPTVIMQ